MLEAPVTVLIILLTSLTSWRAFENPEIKSKLLLNPFAVVHSQQSIRVLSHGLVHANWMHLFFNMFVLYSFGKAVELTFNRSVSEGGFGAIGPLAYLSLYVGALAFASLPSLIKHRDNPYYNALGASGAVFGVMVAFVIMYPMAQLQLLFTIPMRAWFALIVIFGFEYYMQKKGGTGIAHDAHLWGAGFGLLFISLLKFEYLKQFFKTIGDYFF